ncbi:MAG: hypothetical protein QM295_01875 [Bacillota bacterium]|nr:hypothetical protein [Bacillota bacterium]
MDDKWKGRLPNWYEDLYNYDVVITNDIDSLMSFYFIQKQFLFPQIAGFYNFNFYYHATDIKTDKKKLFGVDMDLIKGRTFGNHITYFFKNKDAINLNNTYNIEKYHEKYPFSTTMLILAIYDFDLEKFTDEQLKFILTIDTAYKGYYTDNDYFKGIYTSWLDRLGFRFLEDRILKRMDSENFKKLEKEYNIYGTVEVIKNKLYTNINLSKISLLFGDAVELPQHKFEMANTYNYITIDPMQDVIPDKENIISMAWIFKDMLKMTVK